MVYSSTKANNGRVNGASRKQIGLTTILTIGIIMFTHGQSQRPHPKASSPPQNGHAQSAARAGIGRVIRQQRLLRSKRPPAGEIRNAASRSARRLHSEAGRAAVWFFASVLLSGSGSVHARRPRRAGAAETRTETRSQTVAEGCGVPRADHCRRSRSGPGRHCAAGVRYLGPSTEHRAGISACEKKRRSR